ncbi:MAG TPA: prepilin-type N-terminal cleavage/methylation domain-containing protein [Fimbriimonadaceae bacterium]
MSVAIIDSIFGVEYESGALAGHGKLLGELMMNVSTPNKVHSNKGFTLIELLVVIAIIAILAAILFPVFAQAKLAAKKTAGLSDCKQIALADIMYQNDYDDFVVPGLVPADPGTAELSYEINPGSTFGHNNAYDHLLMPYIKSEGLWSDPGGPLYPIDATHPASKNITMNGDAVIDLSSWAFFPNTPVNGSSVAYPSELILEADGPAAPFNYDSNFSGVEDTAVSACTAWEDQAAGTPPTTFDKMYRLYNESANYALADGHAKSMRVSQTLFPNVMWFKERPAAADMAAAPQGGAPFSFAPPAATPQPISPTMDCHVFQLWDNDGGF